MPSELQVNTITEATSGSGITFAKDVIPATPLSHRNLIINGAMQVSQRGTSFTGLTNGNEGYTLDRFRWDESGAPSAVCTVTQDTSAPAGFSKSLKVAVTTAQTTMAASDHVAIHQNIEAQNLQHLNYGSSSAKSTTLSFHVKSNKTGTYGIWIYTDDASRSISYNYTISTADTWEKKTITIVGDTSGGINDDNGDGLRVYFGLASGSNFTSGSSSWGTDTNNRFKGHNVNVMDSTSNTFYLTGVQLELGSVATPFEHRTYAEELARCQRYFTIVLRENQGAGMSAACDSTTYVRGLTYFPVTLRAAPTLIESDTGIVYRFNGAVNTNNDSTAPAIDVVDVYGGSIGFSGFSGLTAGQGGAVRILNNTSPSGSYLGFDAEL